MITLLFKRGADILAYDSQGYNSLHLAVHAGHAMMIVYLISIGIPVDSRDSVQRTPLMWSAYQGNSIEGLQEILRNNPDIDTTDATGYTALHWSVISQHYEFTKLLLKEGATHTIKDPEGKTPADWAAERETLSYYEAILLECKTGPEHKGTYGVTNASTDRIMYLIPFVLLPTIFLIVSTLSIYISLPMVLYMLYLIQSTFIVSYVLKGKASAMVATPLTSAICQATIFYTILSWLRILPYTSYLYFYHVFFVVSAAASCYSLYKGCTTDPGYIVKSSSPEEKQRIITQLAGQGKLNSREYCVTCCVFFSD